METIQITIPRFEKQARILETSSTPQARWKANDGQGAKCAMQIIYDTDRAAFKELPFTIRDQIMVLNDCDGKTKSEIAEWLRAQK